MARYYATIAGLPNIGVDDRKLPIQIDALQAELREVLTEHDRRLLDLIIMEQELPRVVQTLNAWMGDETISWQEDPEDIELTAELPLETISAEELAAYVKAAMRGDRRPRTRCLPEFIRTYIDRRVPGSEPDEEAAEAEEERLRESEYPYTPRQLRMEEDRLTAMYYEYLMHRRNAFVRGWAEFNLQLRNILAAYTGRELGLDLREYIIGEGELQHSLRTSRAADFGLTEELFPHLRQALSIVREEHIARREQLIDRLRWDWLEEATFFKPFDIDYLLAYYIRVEILERWVSLNEQSGEEIFRRIVSRLKQESTTSLEEFKRKQTK